MFTFNDLFELKKMLAEAKIKENKSLFDKITTLSRLATSDILRHIYQYAGCYVSDVNIILEGSLLYLNHKLYLRMILFKLDAAQQHPIDEAIIVYASFIRIYCNEEAMNVKRLYRSPGSDPIITAKKIIDPFERALKPLFNDVDLEITKNEFRIAKESDYLISDIKLINGFDIFDGYSFGKDFRTYFKNNLMTVAGDEIALPKDVSLITFGKITIKVTEKFKDKLSSYTKIDDNYRSFVDFLSNALYKYIDLYN